MNDEISLISDYIHQKLYDYMEMQLPTGKQR